MKLRLIASIFVFISAYSPLSVIFAIQDFDWISKQFLHPRVIYTMLVVSIVSIIVIFIVLSEKSSTPPVRIVSISNKSGELVNYTVPYMMSFLVVDLSNIKLLISFGFFMLVMFVLSLRTHNLFMNPILAVFKYNLYEVRYTRDGQEFNSSFLCKDGELGVGDECRLSEISDGLFSITKVKN